VAYKVLFTPAAERQLRKLERLIQLKVATVVAALAEDPRHVGVEKMAGGEMYKVRAGRDHRIVFEIRDKQVVIVIIRIGDRKDVYRNL
jgi:mRNA interferase RelE/StbE